MEKTDNINLDNYTEEDIKKIILKLDHKKKKHNLAMRKYYNKQKKKSEEGDIKALQFMEKRRESTRKCYENNKEKYNKKKDYYKRKPMTEERKIRHNAVYLFAYYKKKGGIATFIKNHPEKVEILKIDKYCKISPKEKYKELFTEEELKEDEIPQTEK